jgi:hypothetical protein
MLAIPVFFVHPLCLYRTSLSLIFFCICVFVFSLFISFVLFSQAVLDSLGESTSLREAEQMIKFADTDKDGVVNMADFLTKFQHLSAPPQTQENLQNK